MKFRTEVSGPAATAAPPAGWILDRVREWAARSADRVALAVDHPGRVEEYSYGDVLRRTEQIASSLAASGIRPGDRVGILMENTPQWVFVFLGILRLGGISVPLATLLNESSVRLLVEHAGCRMLFSDGANLSKACGAGARTKVPVIAVSGWDSRAIPWERFANSSVPAAALPNGGNRTAVLMYTSGTTGDPKGVQLSEENLTHEIMGLLEMLELSPDHRILSVLPLSHMLPLIANALGPLCFGARVVFLPTASPQRVIEAFHRHRITFFVCVPQFFYLLHKRVFLQVASQPLLTRAVFRALRRISHLLGNPRVSRMFFSKVHKTIGPDLWLLASGGSRFDERVAQDLADLGYTVVQAYGLTETAAAATVTPVRDNRVGTVGKPLRSVRIRIDSSNGEGVGEVCVAGPILMQGYYKDSQKTAESMREGWLYTGDLGFLDADGNLTITGRSKDVIVLASGKNVYPEEVEVHYQQCPLIKEIAVIGMPETEEGPEGEHLHAVVVPDYDEFKKQGKTGVAEWIRFEMENLSKGLAPYQRVHSIFVRNDPLPRTATRKLKRFEIRAEELNRLRAGSAPSRPATNHPRLTEGVGAIVAELIRAAKPDVAALDPSLNLELDLDFDSLGRVELLGAIEARLNIHLDETRANQIFTVGELLDELDRAAGGELTLGRNWTEIMSTEERDELLEQYILGSNTVMAPVTFVSVWVIYLASKLLFRLKVKGRERLPQTAPFIIAPNHESFLDAVMLCAALPFSVVRQSFFLGYSDYFTGGMRGIAGRLLNIVPVDPSVNLVRSMQLAAAGLRRNKILVVFPEGTRSIDGQLGEFKKGAAILAHELGTPLVPVGLRGTFEAWPRAGRFRLHPVEVWFGEPLDPQTVKGVSDPYSVLNEQLRDAVKELVD